MPKMKLNVEDLNVVTFGTEPVGAEASQALQAVAYTQFEYTCRTCRISWCQDTTCC